MKLLADLHISPRTVEFLNALSHDVIRVDRIIDLTFPDPLIVACASREERTIITQDLDFSAIIAPNRKPTAVANYVAVVIFTR